jgi:hypothetical protein
MYISCGWYDIYLDIVHKVRIIKVQQESKMLQRMIQDHYNSRPLTGLLCMPLLLCVVYRSMIVTVTSPFEMAS